MGKGQGKGRDPEPCGFGRQQCLKAGRASSGCLPTKCRSQASSTQHSWVPSRADPTVTPKADAITSWQQRPCIRGSPVVPESYVFGHVDVASRPCLALPVYPEFNVAVEANNKARLCVFILNLDLAGL